MSTPINPYVPSPVPTLPDGVPRYLDLEFRKLQIVISALVAEIELLKAAG